MQINAVVIMCCNMHWIIHKDYTPDYTFSPQEKGREYEKLSRKKKSYIRSEYTGFNLLSKYRNTSLKPSLEISFEELANPWSKFMEGEHMGEHDIVLSFAGADCFSIFSMSIVLGFCCIKKDIVVSRRGGTASKNCILNC